jgi:hypothetical protein
MCYLEPSIVFKAKIAHHVRIFFIFTIKVKMFVIFFFLESHVKEKPIAYIKWEKCLKKDRMHTLTCITQTLSHDVVSSTPRHEQGSNCQL